MHPPAAHAAFASLLGLLAATSSPGPASDAPADSLRSAIVRAGWTPAEGGEAAPWSLDNPRIKPTEAARVLKLDPAGFPRPAAVRGDRHVVLPMAPHIDLLRRVDDSGPSFVTWAVQATSSDLGGGFAGIDVDVAPFRAPPTAAAARTGESSGPLAAGTDEGLPPMRRQPPRWARTPERPGGRDATQLEATLDQPTRPALVVAALPEISDDVLAVTPDDGRSWIQVRLAPAAAGSFDLGPADLHGVRLGEHPGLLVAPRPRGPAAALTLLAVDPTSLEVRDLGSPTAKAPAWGQVVTDVEARADGTIAAAVIVVDRSLKRSPPADSWGAIVERTPSGEWRELRRFPLPGSDRLLRVRFAAAGGLELRREGLLLARLPAATR